MSTPLARQTRAAGHHLVCSDAFMSFSDALANTFSEARGGKKTALPVLVRSGSGKMAVSLETSSKNRLQRGLRASIILESLPEDDGKRLRGTRSELDVVAESVSYL